MKNQLTIEHEIGGLKKGQSPCKILDLEKKGNPPKGRQLSCLNY